MIARSTVMIAAAISETGPAAIASLLSNCRKREMSGLSLLISACRLLRRRLSGPVIGQFARVVANGVKQVAHEIGEFLAPRGGVRVRRRLADYLRGAGARSLGQRPDVHVAAADDDAPLLGFLRHSCSPPCLKSD